MIGAVTYDFERFHAENPAVYKLFQQFAFRAIRRGLVHYSAKTIFEAIRFHADIVTKGESFKLNNNYTAYYARMFEKDYPEYKGFFEKRKVKTNEN